MEINRIVAVSALSQSVDKEKNKILIYADDIHIATIHKLKDKSCRRLIVRPRSKMPQLLYTVQRLLQNITYLFHFLMQR